MGKRMMRWFVSGPIGVALCVFISASSAHAVPVSVTGNDLIPIRDASSGQIRTKRVHLARAVASAIDKRKDGRRRPIKKATGRSRKWGLNVREFGARGNGKADDTEALQRAIDAAILQREDGHYADRIFMPAGVYRVTHTLKIRETTGLQLIGAGPMSTTLLWDPSAFKTDEHVDSMDHRQGRAEGPMILIQDVADSTFENFGIATTPGNTLSAGIKMESLGGEVVEMKANVFRNMVIDGREAGIRRGVRIAIGVPNEDDEYFNNQHSFEHVTVTNYLEAGFSLEHRSAMGIQFRSCWVLGEERGRSGVATNLGLCDDGSGVNCGGSFFWTGGGGGGNYGADFELGDSQGAIKIVGAWFEGSARFLHTPGPSGAMWPVTIEGVVWQDDMLGQYANSPWPPHEQYHMIKFQFRGPLTITGCKLGVLDELAPAKPSEIIWNPGSNFGQFIFRGNYIASSSPNPFVGAPGLVPSVYPTIQEGNMIQAYGGPGNSNQNIPLRLHPSALTNWSAWPTVGWVKGCREFFTTTAGTDISRLMHGTIGQKITIYSTGERRMVHGEWLHLAGAEDYVLQPGSTVSLAMFAEDIWTETGRCEAPAPAMPGQ